MSRKTTATISAFLILQPFFVHFASAADFPDVRGTAYEHSMTALANDGIIQGYLDGSGRPKSSLNRAEALKVLLATQPLYMQQVVAMKAGMPSLPLFDDVKQDAWYAPYVEVGFKNGLVKGYPDGTFHAGRTVSTEEAIVMIMRAFGESAGSPVFAGSADLQNVPDEWFTPQVNAAIGKNLVMNGSRMQLGRAITRGQFFEMVYRMREVKRLNIAAYQSSAMSVAQQSSQPQPLPVQQAQPVYQQQPQAQPAAQQVSAIPLSSLSSADAAAAMEYSSGKPFAMAIPVLGIQDLVITHPADTRTQDGVLAPLKKGVGHLFAYPGMGGKIMVYGHSSSYPWDLSPFTKIFRTINKISVGNKIYVTYDGKLYVYQVTGKKAVPANDKATFEPDNNGEKLILYTCWPPDSITQRYLVTAEPVHVIDLSR